MRIAQRAFSALFLSALVSVVFTQASPAATHVFKPEDHSVYLDQRDPDINKSDKTGILTASTLNENSRIVIHFDFGGWVPDPASITQAKLHLYHYRGGSYTGTRTLNVYPLTTGFDETTATWNSPWTTPGGDYDNSIYSFADVPEAWNNWVEWDVTDVVKNRLNNVMSFGFLIRDPQEDDTGDGPYVRFRSHRFLSEYPEEVAYLEISTGQTGVEEAGDDEVYRGFSLSQNFPNPFNDRTVLQFDLSKPTRVILVIYNLRGEKVKILLDATRAAGRYALEWDGTNQVGEFVASGLYLYRMRTAEFSDTKRLLYLK